MFEEFTLPVNRPVTFPRYLDAYGDAVPSRAETRRDLFEAFIAYRDQTLHFPPYTVFELGGLEFGFLRQEGGANVEPDMRVVYPRDDPSELGEFL